MEEGEPTKENFDEYFGGVTMFPIETFEKITALIAKNFGFENHKTGKFCCCKRHFDVGMCFYRFRKFIQNIWFDRLKNPDNILCKPDKLSTSLFLLRQSQTFLVFLG